MKAYSLQSDTRENQFIFEGLVLPQGHKWLWGQKKEAKAISNLCPISFLCKMQVSLFFKYLQFTILCNSYLHYKTKQW